MEDQVEQVGSEGGDGVINKPEEDRPLFDWGEDVAPVTVESGDEVVERQPVAGVELLTKPTNELMEEVLAKALGEEKDERAGRYAKWLEEIKAPTTDPRTLAERRGRKELKTYRQEDLTNKSGDELEKLVEDRMEELRFATDGYAYLAKGMETALGEGDMETVVAVMRTELGGVDSVKDMVVEGAERLQQEKGTEAVDGLLPVYEQFVRNGEQDKVVGIMEPAVGYKMWKDEGEKRSELGGELRVNDMPDLLTDPGGSVRFKDLQGKRMVKTEGLFKEVVGKRVGLGEVMADVLGDDEALKEVTKASVISPIEGEREVTEEEIGKTAEILKLRLIGYMEAALADTGGEVKVGLVVKMMEAVSGEDETAWQMIEKNPGEMANKMRQIMEKVRDGKPVLFDEIKRGLHESQTRQVREEWRREEEERKVREAAEAEAAAEAGAKAEKLAKEKVLEDFLAGFKNKDVVDGRIGMIKGIKFGAGAESLRESAEVAKQEESDEAKLVGEVMGKVADLIDGFDVNDLRVERQGLRKVRKPAEMVVEENKQRVIAIQGEEGWEKDRGKITDWAARMVYNRWLSEAKFDKDGRPVVD